MKRGSAKRKLYLEKQNTLLSNERTLFSGIRTGLTAFVLGLALLNFLHSSFGLSAGILFIVLGFLFVVVEAVFYTRKKKLIEKE